MTGSEIEEMIDAHVAAAVRCRAGGFEGVEVWAAYHSLLDRFWTPWSNTRDDRWGGSLKNGTRFSRTIIERIRRERGEDFVIGLAVSTSDNHDVTLSVESPVPIVALHDATGHVDYVTGGYSGCFDFERLMPTFLFAEKLTAAVTARIKAGVRHAKVTSEAHIRTPENAEAVLAAGQAELLSIVRGRIADPHLARMTAERRAEDVQGCISCNQMCWGRRLRDCWMSCLINPSAGREWEWGGDRFAPAARLRPVLVVGAEPAGLEAARAAAQRRHRVEIAEAAPPEGRQFRIAGVQRRRGQTLDLLGWYERPLDRLGVILRLNAFLDGADLAAHPAEVVAVATGSLPDPEAAQRWLPSEARLPGLDAGGGWPPEDVLRREVRLGDVVVVQDEGGNWRGVGTAWALAEQGRRVTVVTPDPFVGREIARTSTDGPARARLGDAVVVQHEGGNWRGVGTAWALAEQGRRVTVVTPEPFVGRESPRTSADGPDRARLARAGARMLTEHVIARWQGNWGTARSLLDGREETIPASALLMATTNVAFDAVPERIPGKEMHRIGDRAAPRQTPYALHEGRRLALALWLTLGRRRAGRREVAPPSDP